MGLTRIITLDFLTKEQADVVFHGANIVLVLALIVGVLATYTIYMSGNVKEYFTNYELKVAREDAAKAVREAGEMHERAAGFERQAAALVKDAETARVEQQRLKEKTANLEMASAVQREKAAKAEKELLELQDRLSPRRLSADQETKFISALPVGHGLVVNLQVSPGGETSQYTDMIAAMLRKAGIKIAQRTNVIVTGGPSEGIRLAQHSEGQANPKMLLLMSAFDAASIPVSGLNADTAIPIDVVRITIGAKP